MDTIWQQIQVADFAFLYSDSVYYDCMVCRIDEYNEGYGILVSSNIEDIPVFSAKNKSTYKHRIKIGKSYKMKLIRYFERPIIRSIEYKHIYNIMLGAKTINVLSTGQFSYLFISPNINGLSYFEPKIVDSLELIKKQKETEMTSFLYDFIISISNEIDSLQLINYVDTLEVSKSLKKYSGYYYQESLYEEFKRPPKKIDYLQWSNLKIDDSRFESLFWGMLSYYYRLPKETISFEDKNNVFKSIKVKVLYFCDDISTVRVKWSIPDRF